MRYLLSSRSSPSFSCTMHERGWYSVAAGGPGSLGASSTRSGCPPCWGARRTCRSPRRASRPWASSTSWATPLSRRCSWGRWRRPWGASGRPEPRPRPSSAGPASCRPAPTFSTRAAASTPPLVCLWQHRLTPQSPPCQWHAPVPHASSRILAASLLCPVSPPGAAESRASTARAVSHWTAIQGSCSVRLPPAPVSSPPGRTPLWLLFLFLCPESPDSLAKAARAWGTRLMLTVADPKYRTEAVAGVVACAGSIGPQFIVSHLKIMPPAVSHPSAPATYRMLCESC